MFSHLPEVVVDTELPSLVKEVDDTESPLQVNPAETSVTIRLPTPVIVFNFEERELWKDTSDSEREVAAADRDELPEANFLLNELEKEEMTGPSNLKYIRSQCSSRKNIYLLSVDTTIVCKMLASHVAS